jgi:hypothetical protein
MYHHFSAAVLIAFAGSICFFFFDWYQQGKHAIWQGPFIKVFNESMLYFIPVGTVFAIAAGYLAYPGVPSMARNTKLLIWQFSLIALAAIYGVHGWEINTDLAYLNGEMMLEGLRRHVAQHPNLQVLVVFLEAVTRLGLLFAETAAPRPLDHFFYLANRPNLILSWAALAPMVVCLVLTVVVQIERQTNMEAVKREEDSNMESEHEPLTRRKLAHPI